jgi:hypothetical protein
MAIAEHVARGQRMVGGKSMKRIGKHCESSSRRSEDKDEKRRKITPVVEIRGEREEG